MSTYWSRQCGKLNDELERLHAALDAASKAIHEIVESDGIDAGVIYLSSDSPTHYDPELGCHVYEHENFSPLGDALVKLAKIIDDARGPNAKGGR